MIINNSHIRGIYLYNDSAEFEKGDFVVYENSIYVCIAQEPTNETNMSVVGRIPGEDTKNYSLYLGDRITTLEEYFDYLNNPDEKEDKFISSHILSEILNYYMTGISEKGIIDEYLVYENGEYKFSKPLENILEGATINNYLDNILQAENLNNCILRLSRNLPDIASKLPSLPEDLKDVINEDDLTSVVLRQYSYIDSSTTDRPIVRLQELIDHINGIVMYRYKSGSGGISEWKSSFLDVDFRNKVQYVKNYYEDLITKVELEKKELVNNFGYRNVKLTKASSVIIQNSNPEDLGYIKTNSFSESSIISIIIQESAGTGNLYKNTSITIDISDSTGTRPINKYYISDKTVLQISNVTESSATLQVNTGRIINIYYRDFFKL